MDFHGFSIFSKFWPPFSGETNGEWQAAGPEIALHRAPGPRWPGPPAATAADDPAGTADARTVRWGCEGSINHNYIDVSYMTIYII
jgi:hypothetical protein